MAAITSAKPLVNHDKCKDDLRDLFSKLRRRKRWCGKKMRLALLSLFVICGTCEIGGHELRATALAAYGECG